MAFGHQGLCQPSVTHKHCLRLRLLGLAARVGHRHRLTARAGRVTVAATVDAAAPHRLRLQRGGHAAP